MTQLLEAPGKTDVGRATGSLTDVGLLGIPPLEFECASRLAVAPTTVPSLLYELKILVLVLTAALMAGALVAAIGIALTV
jgi:hypothetical protein